MPLLILALVTLPAFAWAGEPLLSTPHWSIEVKGGVFAPAVPDWRTYFDSRDIAEFSMTLAYKVRPWLEFGAGAGTMEAQGSARYQQHGTAGGSQTYDLRPVSAFMALRGVYTENQWVVPYCAGGWTRMYYKQSISGQDAVSGSADGYHVRGGLQLSLDNLDLSASKRMYSDYGIYATYLIVEAERSHVIERTTSIDLGGTAYRAGLLFEF